MPKPLLLQSPITDAYYIVTRYTHKTPPEGKPYFVAHTQYDTTAQVQAYIAKATAPLRQELAQAQERIRVLDGAMVALDTILFPGDDHGDAEKSEMRSQLVDGLAQLMERRGWAGTVAENVAAIEAASTRSDTRE